MPKLSFKPALLTWSLVAGLGLITWMPDASALGWGAPQTERPYNVSAVETVSGTVTRIDRATTWRPGQPGVHLLLKTSKETLWVLVGPAWYLERRKVEFRVGDRLKVTGTRATFNDEPALLAGTLFIGDKTVGLRDATGRPAWSSQRR